MRDGWRVSSRGMGACGIVERVLRVVALSCRGAFPHAASFLAGRTLLVCAGSSEH